MSRIGLGRTPCFDAESEHVLSEVSGLAALDVTALRQRWAEVFGEPPPRGLARSLLLRALAYRLQERVLGGLKPPRADSWSESRITPRRSPGSSGPESVPAPC